MSILLVEKEKMSLLNELKNNKNFTDIILPLIKSKQLNIDFDGIIKKRN